MQPCKGNTTWQDNTYASNVALRAQLPVGFGPTPLAAPDADPAAAAAAAAAAEAEAAAAELAAGIGSPVLLFTPNTFARPCNCACVHDPNALFSQYHLRE